MTERSGFERHAAFSVFEAMRPDAGTALDRIVVATYSLDLVAVTALILSLSEAGEEELDAGPLSFLKALETVAPRLTILHQKGRLQVARRHCGVLHLLDGTLQAVDARKRASWHPKIFLARYLGSRGAASWRLWLGSRNLTGSQDREAGLLLRGTLNGRPSKKQGVADMIQGLLSRAASLAAYTDELESLRWQTPSGVTLKRIHWRDLNQTEKPFALASGAKKTLAISPFVDAEGLRAIGHSSKTEIRLLTIPPTAAVLGPLEGIDTHVTVTPASLQPIEVASDGAFPEGELPELPLISGLHAKLILQQKGDRYRLWIGSANLTRRGLNGPNAEVMAELEVDEHVAADLETFFDMHGPAVPNAPSEELKNRQDAERALDDALQTVLEATFELRLTDDGLHLRAIDPLDGFLLGHTLQCWLLTMPEASTEWSPGLRSVLLRAGTVPLRLQTVLVCFRAVSRGDPTICRAWAQTISFPGFQVSARDEAAKAAYIGSGRISAWLRAQLEGIVPTEATTWSGGRRSDAIPGSTSGQATNGMFAVEEVLAAWARNPAAFETRAAELGGVLQALRAELALEGDEGLKGTRELDEIEPFWKAVKACLTEGKG